MDNLNKKTILVCGGAGFIGSNFIHYIFKRYPRVKILNFDRLTYCGSLENLKDIHKDSRYKFIKGDIVNKKFLDKTISSFKPDYIVNFAAATHVDRSIHEDRQEFIKTNVEGVFNILEMVKKFSLIKKYIQISTDEVYGSLDLDSKKAFQETDQLKPRNPYSATKACGDLLCRAYYNTWGIPVVITRSSNNFGPYQYPEKIIPFFILRMLENKNLPLYGDGRNVRDWIYVLDHCRAIETILLKGNPGEIYNISANNERSNLEIARLILNYFKKDESWIEFVSDRPGHDRRYSLDNSKIRKEFGWRPIYNFDKAFKETVDWYLKNKRWVDKFKKKGAFNPHIK